MSEKELRASISELKKMHKTQINLVRNKTGTITKLQNELESLKTNNSLLINYTNQLQGKLNESGALVKHYEQTINVLSGRVLEKDALISTQNNKQNEGTK
tara:strand:+ start:912 stop:1211 length:300 start_codon:yes stop_codon:yes gene_type:complete